MMFQDSPGTARVTMASQDSPGTVRVTMTSRVAIGQNIAPLDMAQYLVEMLAKNKTRLLDKSSVYISMKSATKSPS